MNESKHKPRLIQKRATNSTTSSTTKCSLFLNPTLNSILPTSELISLNWNSTCITSNLGAISTNSIGQSDLIDLYLTVQQSSSIATSSDLTSSTNNNIIIQRWIGLKFNSNSLSTKFNYNWFNASGVGQIKAQLTIVPTTLPIWDTPLSASPQFFISYNTSAPIDTSTTNSSGSTGVGAAGTGTGGGSSESNGIGVTKIAIAVSIPILLIGLGLGFYIYWSRFRKVKVVNRKRWSAVVENRLSIVSQRTVDPINGSIHSRPHSTLHRPSGSIHTTTPTRPNSYFVDQNGRPYSSYSILPESSTLNTPNNALSGESMLRELPPPEMRQLGQGDRISKVSFRDSGEVRGSLDIVAGGSNSSPSKGNGKLSLPSAVHQSGGGGTHRKNASSYSSMSGKYSPPSTTLEELSSSTSSTLNTNNNNNLTTPKKTHHKHKSSIGSSLRQEVSPSLVDDTPLPLPQSNLFLNSTNNNNDSNSISGSFRTAHSSNTGIVGGEQAGEGIARDSDYFHSSTDLLAPSFVTSPSSITGNGTGNGFFLDKTNKDLSPDEVFKNYARNLERSNSTTTINNKSTSTSTGRLGKMFGFFKGSKKVDEGDEVEVLEEKEGEGESLPNLPKFSPFSTLGNLSLPKTG